MATPIHYKKPRRINVVSVTLVLVVSVLVYLGYQWFPLYMMRHEAYRVLQETGSKLAGRAGYYEQDDEAREELRKSMQRELARVGIEDPKLETWIEIEGKEVRLGAVYSAWIEWPFEVRPKQESVYEVEHVVVLH